jgi:hydrogenase 3 maturation protease
MSKSFWTSTRLPKRQLQQKLQHLSQPHPERAPRVAVVGIGNELNGDDGVGVWVARNLQEAVGRVADSPVLIVEAGTAPENVTGALRKFAPILILLIDAAQLNEPPGTIGWVDWRETTGISAITHGLPLHVIAQYLVTEIGCEVALIGIQPRGNAFDTPLSPEVQHAVDEVVQVLQASLPV